MSATPPPATTDGATLTRGVLLGFAAFALFAFSDASVKMIEGKLPPYESAFFGAVFGLAALPFVMHRGDRLRDVFQTVNRPLWILRFLAYPVGVIGSVTAFTHLPMAEAFVLIFLQPAFVTVLSVLWLKEPVGIRRWSAVAIGFVGVLIVLRPGMRELTIGHLGAVFAGMAGAVSVVTYRAAGPAEKRISLIGAGILGAVMICGAMAIPTFVMPSGAEWALLAGYGLLAAFANVLLMQAALRAPAAMVSPTQYSQMLWAIVLGWLFFGDGVDLPMVAGIALIVGSGVMTLLREETRNIPGPRPLGGTTRIGPVTLRRRR